MKTIAELQCEIRGIKNELTSLDKRLENIDGELSNFRDLSPTNTEYINIYELALTFPKISHPILNENVTVKRNYFSLLLMISTLDDSINDEQLLFLQRIILMDNNSKLDDYISNLGNINFQNAIFQLNEVVKNKYRMQLLLDMIILSNLSKGTEKKSYEIISSFAAVVNCSKQDVGMLAQIAKTILLNDISYLPHKADVTSFDYYLCEIPEYSKVLYKQMSDVIRFFHSSKEW